MWYCIPFLLIPLVTFEQFCSALSPAHLSRLPSLDDSIVEAYNLGGLQIPYNNSVEDVLAHFMALAQFHPKMKDQVNIEGDERSAALLAVVMARASMLAVLNQALSGALEWIDFGKYNVCSR